MAKRAVARNKIESHIVPVEEARDCCLSPRGLGLSFHLQAGRAGTRKTESPYPVSTFPGILGTHFGDSILNSMLGDWGRNCHDGGVDRARQAATEISILFPKPYTVPETGPKPKSRHAERLIAQNAIL